MELKTTTVPEIAEAIAILKKVLYGCDFNSKEYEMIEGTIKSLCDKLKQITVKQ